MMIGSIPPQLVSHVPIKESHPGKTFKKWTKEQDQKFIELYGQGLYWEDIAAQIPGKTEELCKDHWKRVLQKKMERRGQLLEIEQQRQKSIGQPIGQQPIKSKKWTEEENEELIELYKQGLDWKDISILLLSGTTSTQCREHWYQLRKRIEENGNGQLLEIEQQRQKSIEPHQNGHKTGHVQWTEEEDKDLIELYKQGLGWGEIAAQIPNRTRKSCFNHWEHLRKRIEKNGNGQLLEIEQQRQKLIEPHQNSHKTGPGQWTEEFKEFMKTDQKSLKKRERTTEENEGDRAIKRARMQLSSSIPVSSPPPQAVVPTVDFTKGEAFTDLIEPESVSDSLAFFDANFPRNSEDAFSATSSAETPMHHDNQIMTQQENMDKSYEDKSYEEYCDFGFR